MPIRWIAASTCGLWLATPAWAWTAAENATRNLVQGRCDAAVDEVNEGLKEGDPRAYYLVGLMNVRGLCVKARPERAPAYLEPAAKAGEDDAARLLVMLHGLGMGVPQSYAQAGRWAIARQDILRARRSADAASQPDTRSIALTDAEALGVLATIHAAVAHRLAYPKSGARTQAENVTLVVTLAIGPQGISYEVSDREASIKSELGGSNIVRRSSVPHGEHVVRLLDEVIGELKPLPVVDRPYTLAVDVRFTVQ